MRHYLREWWQKGIDARVAEYQAERKHRYLLMVIRESPELTLEQCREYVDEFWKEQEYN